jgi:sec-independent protein translocase protein TatC
MERFSYELEKLRGTILRPVILFFIVSLALLVLGTPTFATQIFLSAKLFLVPGNVPLVALGPVSVFMAPLVMSFLISLLVTFPYMLYSFGKYLRPALYPKERATMYTFVLPSLILFYLGSAFGYFFIIPITFSILYSFAAPIGVTPFFSLDSFISSVFLLTVSVGIIFLLPMLMALLAKLSIMPYERWLKNWRGVLVLALIFSAVVTPDGSGITMVFLFVPIVLLYGIGLVVCKKIAAYSTWLISPS